MLSFVIPRAEGRWVASHFAAMSNHGGTVAAIGVYFKCLLVFLFRNIAQDIMVEKSSRGSNDTGAEKPLQQVMKNDSPEEICHLLRLLLHLMLVK